MSNEVADRVVDQVASKWGEMVDGTSDSLNKASVAVEILSNEVVFDLDREGLVVHHVDDLA